ncbi:MAG: hypothetical protein BIFFINMI_01617 [Phycisphaerae bacterium]|nr:hypothetical protein [Phycisphaerae bacterium]
MSEWQEKLITELKRDWRRTSILVVLTIVALVLVIRQFAGGDPGTAKANAIAPDKPATSRSKGSQPTAATAAATRAPVSAEAIKAAWQDPATLARVALPTFNRDPFVINFNSFPPAPKTDKKGAEGVQIPESAQAEQKRQAQLEILRAEAGRLKLQSILMGSEPRVIVNGEIYHVGDLIRADAKCQPFNLTRIASTSAVLERDGFEVILRLE